MQNNTIKGEVPENTPPLNNEIDNSNLQKSDITSKSSSINYDEILEKCKDFSRSEIGEENLKEFALNFAKNCNYVGIPKNVAEIYVLYRFKLSQDEISNCFEQVYLENAEEFAQFVSIENLQEWKQTMNEELSSNFTAPPLPNWIFEKLPDLLKKTCNIFEDKRERDVFFTGALGVLSGCLPNTEGIYDKSKIYPNLFAFIIAPPASGKGVLKFAKYLGDIKHLHLLSESKQQRKEYKQKLELYNKRAKKGNFDIKKPKEVELKLLYIPADISLSRIVQHLDENRGKGIIFETEADTMSNAQSKEWGDSSHLLRKVFHHEPYTFSRRGNDEFIEITEPKVSVVLTGTPSQLPKLIDSVEDGLYSRFIFYNFKPEIIWKDPFSNSLQNFDEDFKIIGDEVLEISNFLEENPTKVHLSNKQREEFNEKFIKFLSETVENKGEYASSIVFRIGLIMYKICLILTALKKVQNRDTTERLECTDEDFFIALSICEVYLIHSINIFDSLPKRGVNNSEKRSYRTDIFNDLPDKFSRGDAIAIAPKYGISPRTIDSILSNAKGKLIRKINSRIFQKI